MAPSEVIGLSPHLRAGLHLAAQIEAVLSPSLLPIVPRLPRGASAEDVGDVLAIQRYRQAIEEVIFPVDDDG